ncbi:AraC family transcriptional regulator [Paenibacillus sp. GYB003]|jgi:AraC family transcriptional activator of pobA|uniref:AraC family transcriptional regulator n=1 Tax=Paenibacillus sp. GYB003 TaxID=2994392 RepID=UPI002F96E8D7
MLAQTDFIFHAMRPADTYMPMHRHRCYELVYYMAGTGVTRLDDLEYRYEPNTYTVIPPGMPHDERRLADTDVLFIGFSLVSRDMPSLQHGLFQDSDPASILGLLLGMKAEMHEKHAFYAQKLNLRMSEILIEHARSVAPGQPGRPDDNLLYARTFIDENFNQKIAVEDLAAMAGYSYHHFRHLFKKKFGVSPIRYLIDKRLEKARSLLRFTELPVSSVASECGFSNDAQFCTIFKRELGETPRAFRNNEFRRSL